MGPDRVPGGTWTRIGSLRAMRGLAGSRPADGQQAQDQQAQDQQAQDQQAERRPERMKTPRPERIGLVLGAGGVVGAAWMTGALHAVQERLPVPAGQVDLIVGTSAGSVLAAALRCGVSLEDMVALQRGEPVPGLRQAGVRDLDDGPLPPRPQLRAGSPRLMLASVLTPHRVHPGVGASAWLPRGRARHEALRATVEALDRGRDGADPAPEAWADGRTWIVAVDYAGQPCNYRVLRALAHEQGIALPVKDYWDFDRLVTVSDPRGVPNLDALDQIYHWTELIQSSPLAVEMSVHAAIGGAYRSQGITTLELRFNPMKRNRGGERDLDHIILAAIRGLDRARLEYPQVEAGLILMMDRTFTARQNEIIVQKAIAWASRGIVGVDIAGPRPGGARYDYRTVQPMVEEARAAGLGVTIHVGEEGGDMGREELGEVLEVLRPDRIGHGILAAGDEELMRELKAAEVVLEICPTSNLLTKALPDEDAVRDVFRTFVEHGVRFTIATDGPEMMHTHLRDELELLLRIGALTQDELDEANARGHEASFVRGGFRAARV